MRPWTIASAVAFTAALLAAPTLASAPQTEFDITVSAAQSGPQSAPTTHPAYVLSREYGPTMEYGDGAQYTEALAPSIVLRDVKFMRVHRVRDAPSGDKTDFENFCNAGIGFSAGYPDTGGSGPGGVQTQNDVQSSLVSLKNLTGCYPSRIDPGNEDDNSGNFDLIDAASPGTACPSQTISSSNPCDVPKWAYDTAYEIKSMRSAVNALNADCPTHPNAAGGCIQVFGASMKTANPGDSTQNHLLILDQAWYDMYGNVPFPIDIAVQHNILSQNGQCASDNITSCGFSAAYYNVPYAKETVSGHSPSGGFSGYCAPGSNCFVPQNYEPVFGRETMYYAANADVDNPLFVHYAPRDLLTAVNYNIDDLDFDFFADRADSSVSLSFAQLGWIDSLGNLKAGAYAVANMESLVGYGNTGGLPQANVSQINYTVNGPSNIISYNYEDDNGNYWIALVSNTNEGIAYPNAGNENLKQNQPAPYPKQSPGFQNCVSRSSDPNQDNCFNLSYQGVHYSFVPFTTVSISGLPSNIDHAVVYQNDEYCDNTMTQDAIPNGIAYQPYPTGRNKDCMQYWPAGSLQNSVQPSYPTITNHTISGLKVNGMPLFIHLGSNQLPVIPTNTPMPYVVAPTAAPNARVTPRAYNPLPTPVPQFGPPTGSVPTPPV